MKLTRKEVCRRYYLKNKDKIKERYHKTYVSKKKARSFICGICDQLFNSYTHNAKYCSKKCKYKAGNMRRYVTLKEHSCNICGKGFISSTKKYYCSDRCRARGKQSPRKLEYDKQWQENNPESRRNSRIKWQAKARDELKDYYVIKSIQGMARKNGFKIKWESITNELIELKRKQLRVHRLIVSNV